jgi:hypothetical protein
MGLQQNRRVLRRHANPPLTIQDVSEQKAISEHSFKPPDGGSELLLPQPFVSCLMQGQGRAKRRIYGL